MTENKKADKSKDDKKEKPDVSVPDDFTTTRLARKKYEQKKDL